MTDNVEYLTSRLTLDHPKLHDSAVRTYKTMQIAKSMLFDARINNFDGADVVALTKLIIEGADK